MRLSYAGEGHPLSLLMCVYLSPTICVPPDPHDG
jgi:hypothetical protein